MVYRDTFKQWVSTLDKCDLAYRVEYPSENDKEYLEHIFGVDFIRAFEEVGYAGGIEMPWTAETLSFFTLSEIVEAQAGYRFDANTGQASEAWDANHYVISAWAGDPVTIDVSGVVWFSRHGEGEWQYKRLASNFCEYLNILNRWADFFVIENSKDIFNDDFSIPKSICEEVNRSVINSLGSEEKSNWLEFLFD